MFKLDHRRRGKIFLELIDVLDPCTAPSIDRLIVVANDERNAVLAGEQPAIVGDDVDRADTCEAVAEAEQYFRPGGRGDAPYNGRTWTSWAAKAAEDTTQGFGQAVSSFRAADTDVISEQLAVMAKKAVTSVQTLAATSANQGVNQARLASMVTLAALVHVRWDNVLDGKTSPLRRRAFPQRSNRRTVRRGELQGVRRRNPGKRTLRA